MRVIKNVKDQQWTSTNFIIHNIAMIIFITFIYIKFHNCKEIKNAIGNSNFSHSLLLPREVCLKHNDTLVLNVDGSAVKN